MATNDIVLLDAILTDRAAADLPSDKRDEIFEYLSFEQVLKQYDLSREEIESGWVDGRNDGGIDGFYTLIDGALLQDSDSFRWPRQHPEIDVYVISSKLQPTFIQSPINSMIASLPGLLDLSADPTSVRDQYGEEVWAARTRLRNAYVRLSSVRPSLHFHFYYVSRGDITAIATNVQSRADQVVEIPPRFFSDCRSHFSFWGATELIKAYRRTKSFSFDVRTQELMTTGTGNYVAIVRLSDYKDLVTDDAGNLKRYLFESNVRDYLGTTAVNVDISESLADVDSPEFWWLNNGVTILATAAQSSGKILSLHDIQIVNGLQTTESIYNHFKSGSQVSLDKALLVKVLVSRDTIVRDKIIRATNNQNQVDGSSLYATDKVQRDIEEILERYDWYYERRKNYYRNIGKPLSRFVTPLYLAAGYLALVLRRPAAAAQMRSRFMRTKEQYEEAFPASAPLLAWVSITSILKSTEGFLTEIRRNEEANTERFVATSRNLVSFIAVSVVLRTYNYTLDQLIDFDVDNLTQSLVADIWGILQAQRRPFVSRIRRDFKRQGYVSECCGACAKAFGIEGIERVNAQARIHLKHPRNLTIPRFGPAHADLSEDFIQRVADALPAQPWKPGTHLRVSAGLGCSLKDFNAAVDVLILRGRFYSQRDGVLYSQQGEIIGYDPARVDPSDL